MRNQTKIYLLIFIGLLIFAGVFSYVKIHRQHGPVAHKTAKKQMYQCPMHPQYTSDKPGTCPICGMTLVPVAEAKEEPQKPSVPGLAEVKISAEREQLIGVKTDVARKRELVLNVRASGRIAHDIDLYNAIVEYRQALDAKNQAVSSGVSTEFLQQADSLLNSSLLKLRHMGLSNGQIEELSKSSEPPTNLIYAGKAGGTVWVYAQIYEYEAGLVRPGQEIEATSLALPGRRFRGTIKSVDAFLDAETRTLKVRAEVPNPEGLLKPEMYVDVTIRVNLGNKLSVPDDAVIDTGTRQLVFVKKGPGVYQPREVGVGYEAGGYYEILSGLSSDEEVVTSANFLIDSESRLKSAIREMQGMPGMPGMEHKHGK